jgi:probable HAF family extracellular repeat protein
MSMLRQLRNFWIPWLTLIVLACFSDAVAQASYKVTDLGTLNNDNFGMAMGLNNHGWTENMDGVVTLSDPLSFTATVVKGRAVINIDRRNIDLGTLGGKNSWINWGGINDRGEAVGMAETSVPDPDGEDVCGFRTGLTCSPFLWRDGHMSALPTVGGNNGQASAINNRAEIAGFAENGALDTSCPPGTTNNRIALPVRWEKGNAHALPLVGSDPDGVAFGINDQGQAVGYSGTCTTALHGVSWENGMVSPLLDLGTGAIAMGINNRGQIVGQVGSPDGTTFYAAVWQNGADGAVTNLRTLPGDFAAFATGINNRDQVVGSTLDSGFNWSHGFIWQNRVMTDLNTLFPADSNLFVISASNINERGQISGMATVLTGPDTGNVHAYLATPVNARIGASVADVARTHPKSNLPANLHKQHLQRFGLVHRFER